MSRICVFGAGAVGSHLAARLAKAGVDVSVIARGATLHALRTNGLRFESPGPSFTVPVRVTDQPTELGEQDLLIVALKAYALPEAVDAMLSLLGPQTVVVFAVNGIPWWYAPGSAAREAGQATDQPSDRRGSLRLDPQGRLHDVLGRHRVLGCVVSSPNRISAPGVVQNLSERNGFELGEPDGGQSARLSRWADELGRAIPGLRATADLRTAIWTKLLLNVPSSSLSTLTDCEPGQLAGVPEMDHLYEVLVQETQRVAAAQGCPLSADVPARLRDMAGSRHVPSMLQDLRSGRPLEIDAQLRAVQDLARAQDVATPVLDVTLALLAQRVAAAGR